jgi:hypothetical protein
VAYSQGDISGKIVYHNEAETPLPDVKLDLYDAEGNYYATTFTDDDGEYLFEGLDNGSYTIEPSYTAEGGGASMQDAVLIMLHLIGVHELEGIEAIAADVDADDEITWLDHGLVVLHFFTGEPFPAGDWVFEDITHTVGSKEGGGDENYGSSAGDVAGAWEIGLYNRPMVEATYTAHSLMPNTAEALSVNATADIRINGAGLVINYPAAYLEVTSVATSLEGAEVREENGSILLAWTSADAEPVQIAKGEELITFKASLTGDPQEALRFTLSSRSHLANAESKIIKGAAINLPEIKASANIAEITRIAPNPVHTSATVAFNLRKPGMVTIDVIDLSGKVVQTLASRYFAKGAQQIDFQRGNLESGIYMLQLKTASSKSNQVQKVIFR